MLKSLFRKEKPEIPAPRVPDDVRVYAIGDVHGCNEEFGRLLTRIDADHAGRTPLRQIIVLLGDLVDRGPDSAGVVQRAMELSQSGREVHLIAGNHEELLLDSCIGDDKALRIFARNGGRETALSYGISDDDYDAADFTELQRLLEAHVPPEHRDFLTQMEQMVVIGDYAFVHAGVRPGVPFEEQASADLRWIRDRFLNHTEPFERFVIHGHTITEDVDEKPNRIGIDTGAYLGGPLTAIALEGDQRWFLTS